jgi:tryptophan 2,3-dioxygenase
MSEEDAKSYADYLKVPELLSLQRTLTGAHDELQFIIVHQAFELWFKLMLFELESWRTALDKNDLEQAEHYAKRVHSILGLLTASFEVIETMRPYEFMQFRERLKPASGLQSLQFREIEFICGLKDTRYMKLSGDAQGVLKKRADEPSLWDAYVKLLAVHGLANGDAEQVLASVSQIMKQPDHHPLGHVTEDLVELDAAFSLWRARHIRMTMRMIGAKPGTGEVSVGALEGQGYRHMGPAGVDYLSTTLNKVFFPVLWEARTFIER